jgi:hypothetical protein
LRKAYDHRSTSWLSDVHPHIAPYKEDSHFGKSIIPKAQYSTLTKIARGGSCSQAEAFHLKKQHIIVFSLDISINLWRLKSYWATKKPTRPVCTRVLGLLTVSFRHQYYVLLKSPQVDPSAALGLEATTKMPLHYYDPSRLRASSVLELLMSHVKPNLKRVAFIDAQWLQI